MAARKIAYLAIAFALALCLPASGSKAAEYGYTTFPLGFAAFGAGITPPPGPYLNDIAGFYSAKIDRLRVTGAPTDTNTKIDLFLNYVSILYVPNTEVLGGHLGFRLAAPAGYISINSRPLDIVAPPAHTEGGGLGDLIYQAQLGWDIGDFSHTVHFAILAPTGRYETGFKPITGLNRPAFDLGWAFTWLDKATQIQFNGDFGYTTSIENYANQYQTGDEFRFEWAVGKKFESGLIVGIVGYDYRQVTGNSGPGAQSSFVGKVDAVGLGLTYSTKIEDTAVTFAARNYEEYHSVHHFRGNLSIATVTAGF